MKEWFTTYKYYVMGMVLLLVVLGYYFFAPTPSENLQIAKTPQFENNPSTDTTNQSKEIVKEESPQQIMIDMKGEVQQPGVYEAKIGERVIDLIERAGGFTEMADQSKVNLAMYVEDQMVIAIPKLGDTTIDFVVETGVAAQSQSDKVNINKADATELETLPGIGPSKSAAILEYRTNTGLFKSIEEIQSISGIGEKTFEKLKDKITVD